MLEAAYCRVAKQYSIDTTFIVRVVGCVGYLCMLSLHNLAPKCHQTQLTDIHHNGGACARVVVTPNLARRCMTDHKGFSEHRTSVFLSHTTLCRGRT